MEELLHLNNGEYNLGELLTKCWTSKRISEKEECLQKLGGRRKMGYKRNGYTVWRHFWST